MNLFKKREYPAVVQQIHNEFSAASELLLKEAQIIIERMPKTLIDKGRRLASLGFHKTQEAQQAKEHENTLNITTQEVEAIKKYQQKYPLNKFISERQVKAICEKYNLVCGSISGYKGFVPERNLTEIENFLKYFKLDIDIVVFDRNDEFIGFALESDIMPKILPYFEKQGKCYVEFKSGDINIKGGEARYGEYSTFKRIQSPSDVPMKICAPLKDMDTTGKTLADYKLVNIPDPVVLQPVECGYLIVTAWGDEASDENVINTINQ